MKFNLSFIGRVRSQRTRRPRRSLTPKSTAPPRRSNKWNVEQFGIWPIPVRPCNFRTRFSRHRYQQHNITDTIATARATNDERDKRRTSKDWRSNVWTVRLALFVSTWQIFSLVCKIYERTVKITIIMVRKANKMFFDMPCHFHFKSRQIYFNHFFSVLIEFVLIYWNAW